LKVVSTQFRCSFEKPLPRRGFLFYHQDMQQVSHGKRRLLSAFIVFNILAILFGTSQVIPETALKNIFHPYLHWLRLSQSWILFGPDPATYAKKYRVDVQFADLTYASWSRPN